MTPFGTGAHESAFDHRTWQHPLDLAAPLNTAGVVYTPKDIEHQHNVGICTGISLVQNAQKANGKKYSPDFQYLLQKKLIDPNWVEGSSIFAALKVGKTVGFLPRELFTWVTEEDRKLPYAQYIAKLQSIPNAEVARLSSLCVDKLAGYAQLPVDLVSLAHGVSDSKAGILCRYEVGKEWWTPSWLTKDIDPLRAPQQIVSGHAIGQTYFEAEEVMFTLANTWGTDWNAQGNAHVYPSSYSCTEAWIPYYQTPAPSFHHNFVVDLQLGQTSGDIVALQTALQIDGEFPQNLPCTGFYGEITRRAVLQYQLKYKVAPVTELNALQGKRVGAKTRAQLNKQFN